MEIRTGDIQKDLQTDRQNLTLLVHMIIEVVFEFEENYFDK